MAYNGSGTFLINTAGQPVVAGTVISSTTFNSLTADLATGLSTVITKDGQTTVTANIPMASFKFTGLGVGSAAGDSANLSQVQSTVTKLLTSVSGTDTITAVGAPVVAAYAAGQMFYFVATGDNTTSVTINIDGLGAKAVTRDGSVALVAGDIKSGEVVVVVYDGTRFQVVSQLNSAGNATFANVSITSALNVGGVATFSAGTAAAPSITTTGDTNTGIFFPAADTIAFTEGGVEAMRIDSSGQVGIGMTPARKLDVTGTFGATGAATFGSTIASGAITSTGRITQTLAPVAAEYALRSTGQTTGWIAIEMANTGGSYIVAGENSTGNNLIVGDSAYDMVIRGPSAISFSANAGATQHMRLDSSGNLGLGVTPSAWQTFTSALEVPGGALAGISANQVGVWQNCFYNSSSFKYKSTAAATLYQQAGAVHAWYNAASGTAGNAISFTQAMTLDASGNLLVGTTSALANGGRFQVLGVALAGAANIQVGTNAYPAINFNNAGGVQQGYIVTNAASVAYTSVSDYRLKNTIAPMTGALAKVALLKPCTYKWNADGSDGQGFIAHELAEVVPDCVTGEKDAVDAEGKPQYQGVDTSFLVATLTAAIQELTARVAQLESK